MMKTFFVFWVVLVLVSEQITVDGGTFPTISPLAVKEGIASPKINFTDPSIVQGMRVCGCSGNITQQGFRLKSSVPVALYIYIAEKDGSGAVQFLIVPVSMLGLQYPVLTAAGYPFTTGTFTGIAVASQDGTTFADYFVQRTLNRLDVYSNIGHPSSGIWANVPFAYFGTTSAHSTIMLLPISSTSALLPPDFHSLPFNTQISTFESDVKASINSANNVDVPRVFSSSPPLVVRSDNGAAISVNATKSVQVYRITPSYEYSYAPEYFLRTSIQFYLFANDNYPPSVNIIVPRQSTGNILLDGKAIPALQYRRVSPNSNYYYYRQTVMVGQTNPSWLQQHTISTMSSNDRYMVDVRYRGSYQKFPIAMDINFEK